MMDQAFLIGLLAAGVRFGTPILFAALGELVNQRAGVLNVGLEGIMLVGAFLAVACAVATGSPWGGLAGAILGGPHWARCTVSSRCGSRSTRS